MFSNFAAVDPTQPTKNWKILNQPDPTQPNSTQPMDNSSLESLNRVALPLGSLVRVHLLRGRSDDVRELRDEERVTAVCLCLAPSVRSALRL